MRHYSHPRAVVLTVAVLLAGGAPGLSAQQTPGPPQGAEIVYVNSQQVLQQAPGATDAQQTWNREVEQYRSEVQALAAEIDSLQQALESQRDMLSDSAVQRRERAIAQKQQQLSERAQQLEQQAAQRREELLGPILEEIGRVIEEIRAERGYSMVFDISSSGLQAAAPRLNITGLVVERLREGSADADADAGADGGSGS